MSTEKAFNRTNQTKTASGKNGSPTHNSRSVDSMHTIVERNTTRLVAQSKALRIQVLSNEFVGRVSFQIVLSCSIQTTDINGRLFRTWTLATYVLSTLWTPLWKAIPRELFLRPWHISSRLWATNLSPASFSSSCWAARHKLMEIVNNVIFRNIVLNIYIYGFEHF